MQSISEMRVTLAMVENTIEKVDELLGDLEYQAEQESAVKAVHLLKDIHALMSKRIIRIQAEYIREGGWGIK